MGDRAFILDLPIKVCGLFCMPIRNAVAVSDVEGEILFMSSEAINIFRNISIRYTLTDLEHAADEMLPNYFDMHRRQMQASQLYHMRHNTVAL